MVLRRMINYSVLFADRKEGQLLDQFNGLLHGFKELKLDRHQSDALYASIRKLNSPIPTGLTSTHHKEHHPDQVAHNYIP